MQEFPLFFNQSSNVSFKNTLKQRPAPPSLQQPKVLHPMATKLYIVFYSTRGHVEKLVHEIKKGVDSVEVVEAKLWQEKERYFRASLAKKFKAVEKSLEYGDSDGGCYSDLYQAPETLSKEVLGKMGAPPTNDVPVITPHELPEADDFIFGYPTRFGMMAAQFKDFMDATGSLWGAQKLAGKAAGIFYSTGSQ